MRPATDRFPPLSSSLDPEQAAAAVAVGTVVVAVAVAVTTAAAVAATVAVATVSLASVLFQANHLCAQGSSRVRHFGVALHKASKGIQAVLCECLTACVSEC